MISFGVAAVYKALDRHAEANQLAGRLSRLFLAFTTKKWNYLALIRNMYSGDRIHRLIASAGIR
jgi:hypothetical protein